MIVTASSDGGQTFSPVAFANQPLTSIDAITGKTITVQPIPDNVSAGNPNRDTSTAFGDRQGLAVYGGKIYPVWSGNLNGTHDPNDVGDRTIYGNNRMEIMSNVLTIPAGPRILGSTMGAVGESGDTPEQHARHRRWPAGQELRRHLRSPGRSQHLHEGRRHRHLPRPAHSGHAIPACQFRF